MFFEGINFEEIIKIWSDNYVKKNDFLFYDYVLYFCVCGFIYCVEKF